MPAPLSARLRSAPMHVLPHHALSWLMRVATRIRFRPWKDWQMRWFIRRYQVDMSLARRPDPASYGHFNEFFTRALTAAARPVCDGESSVACPADGRLSALGAIDGDTLVQAKGRTFSLTRLLGGDPSRAAPFVDGHFATVYLSPRDYHRVHMPLAGQLRQMIHVPGRLFSVNAASTQAVDGLFARNERVVSIFDTRHGPMALVLVGAVFVGSIETVWAGEVAPARGNPVRRTDYPATGPDAIDLARGQEMGRFNMGSTVVMVLPPGGLTWAQNMSPGAPVNMGQALAELSAE
jgi:phosphatidylserine decarboxylase